ncbi:MAG: DUF6029 family protein [Marinifilaceae bacterium]|jgi:hypothetical protein|nr:DUF6029 family protein [Marinifilaceae bacterium]
MIKPIFSLYFILLCQQAYSQTQDQFNISFESNNQYYKSDSKTGAEKPDDKFGSNSYIDLLYYSKNISAGIRLESYNPALMSYSKQYEDTDIANKYIKFTNNKFSVCAGNFYEQFGSGAIFRAYEERALGIDNSLLGINLKFTPSSYLNLTVFTGKQRKGFETANSNIRGADLEFNISEKLDISKMGIIIGASSINKYESYTGTKDNYPSSINAYGGRLKTEHNIFSLEAEYIEKDTEISIGSNFVTGKTLILNYALYLGNISGSFNFRCLKDMDFKAERNSRDNIQDLNYLPVLTKQQVNSLSNIYVYSTQSNSEIGFQADIFYKFKKKTVLGGKYGSLINFNYSKYKNLKINEKSKEREFLESGNELLFEDLNLELKRKFSKKIDTKFYYQQSSYNKGFIEEGGQKLLIKSKIAVAEILYKVNKKNALRTTIQHLWTKQDKKNWFAASLELNFAPKYSFFILDDYNYGDSEKTHYYKFGGTYSKNDNRIEISYSRNRGGISCVGGVCRYLPAMTGLNFSIISKF